MRKNSRFFLRTIFNYRVENYDLQRPVIPVIRETRIFTLPSTSPRNKSLEQNKQYWYELA